MATPMAAAHRDRIHSLRNSMTITPNAAVAGCGSIRRMAEMTRRQVLSSLSALAVAPRVFAQAAPRPIRVRTLNHFGIAVADTKRSVEFYQGLFGLPVRARLGPTTLLQIGAGP